MSPSLFRVGRRYLFRRPLQTILVILGIALGVAVVIAIDLANESASRAFTISTEAVSGKATHQIVGGPSGVPATVYARLRRELGLRAVAPVVSEYVVVKELGERPMRLLGVDPFSEPPFRSYLGGASAPSVEEREKSQSTPSSEEGEAESQAEGSSEEGEAESQAEGSSEEEEAESEPGPSSSDPPLWVQQLTTLLTEPNSLFLSQEVAEQNNIKLDDELTLSIGTREEIVKVAGLLAPSDELSRRGLDSLLLADIATAQELLEQTGRLSNIDLILPEGEGQEELIKLIEALLPPGVAIERASRRTQTIEQLTSAFELNLTALSLLALVVGMFLIYNTITFSVVQRRAVLGTLRAIGVTRREIFALILSEAVLMGLIGSLFGMGLGIFLGRGAVRLITQTINDLYFVVSVEGIEINARTLLIGGAVGVASALLSAIPPAWEAASVQPAVALRRSTIESRVHAILPVLSLVAVGLGGLGVLLLFVSSRSIVLPFAGLFVIVIGFACLTPLVTVQLMKLFSLPLAGFGILGRMAPRDIVRALSRTSVAIAALMVAVSVIVGVSIMIGSFRNTVIKWLDATLQADIYISPPSVSANRSQAPLDPAIAEQIANLPNITGIATVRGVDVSSPDLGQVQLVAVNDDLSRGERDFQWVEGTQEEVWARIKSENALLVSEPFAYRHQIEPGGTVRLLTDRGERVFSVLGVYYDYSSEQGAVLMSYSIYRQLYDDPYISSVAAYVAPESDVDALVNQLRTFFAGKESLVIRSNVGLRTSVLEVFERAFAITGALQILATIVAFIGVLAALMALQLERARELGTLRAVGMTPQQLWALTMLETGLMGSTAGLWAMPTGLSLAVVLIYVINRRSFGWTLQLQLAPTYFLEAFAVALIAALLAGIYPALRMSKIRISQAIRSE
ncbi:MAG: FtsX-like permease family protein [Ardenticatenaceae bacterium]